jgi:hypothetical protein
VRTRLAKEELFNISNSRQTVRPDVKSFQRSWSSTLVAPPSLGINQGSSTMTAGEDDTLIPSARSLWKMTGIVLSTIEISSIKE